MMLQLHVWGPAFDLPSIDPQCLAAIAYLSHAVPKEHWELIPSSAPTYSPTRELPALRDDSIWIGGFQNIVHHLQQKEGERWDLDQVCSSQDRADIAAYTSFLEIRGQPLVDLSLYLSSENYHASTRPAYSHILGWPTSWIIPPQRRAAAKTRTNNLDLSSLDLDSSKGNDVNSPEQGAAAEIPSSLRSALHKGSSTAKQAKHAARFRLDALTESFLEPLVQLLDGKRYLLSEDRITSLDCLALGYLSLALVPGLPIPWLSQLMKSRYPCLCHYVEDLARDCYGISIHSRDGMSRDKDMAMKLPCNGTDAPALPASVRGRGFLEQLPLVGPYYKPASLQQSTAKTHEELSAIPVIPTVFVGLVASLATMGGFIAYTGEVPSVMDSIWPLHRRNSQQRLNEMGEAGALLGAIDFRGASV